MLICDSYILYAGSYNLITSTYKVWLMMSHSKPTYHTCDQRERYIISGRSGVYRFPRDAMYSAVEIIGGVRVYGNLLLYMARAL